MCTSITWIRRIHRGRAGLPARPDGATYDWSEHFSWVKGNTRSSLAEFSARRHQQHPQRSSLGVFGWILQLLPVFFLTRVLIRLLFLDTMATSRSRRHRAVVAGQGRPRHRDFGRYSPTHFQNSVGFMRKMTGDQAAVYVELWLRYENQWYRSRQDNNEGNLPIRPVVLEGRKRYRRNL